MKTQALRYWLLAMVSLSVCQPTFAIIASVNLTVGGVSDNSEQDADKRPCIIEIRTPLQSGFTGIVKATDAGGRSGIVVSSSTLTGTNSEVFTRNINFRGPGSLWVSALGSLIPASGAGGPFKTTGNEVINATASVNTFDNNSPEIDITFPSNLQLPYVFYKQDIHQGAYSGSGLLIGRLAWNNLGEEMRLSLPSSAEFNLNVPESGSTAPLIVLAGLALCGFGRAVRPARNTTALHPQH